ncbi:protein draper isoform X2 [Eurytemora carolleeae]|uniref:protein draper isoform X2 n=1 Tax=Eurytemora carolleeae TaxID=1294199 RepID=UPI000C760777|nr:protein draper isoform X2 [Eurytemora carolleeae]|eukprot:XP_023340661.1 protein draper-like isoform X2 [Eurytemora affinis]
MRGIYCSLVLYLHASGSVLSTSTDLKGENICPYNDVETKTINTTYLQAAQIKEYKFCLTQLTLRCAEYKTVMETKWKTENITRVVINKACCDGYKEHEGACVPHCTRPCINGACTAPEQCTCSSGFSGGRCEVSGCPGGRWGPDCVHECTCENGGYCNQVTGACSCTPGYQGLRCQNSCFPGFFGAGCLEKCSCNSGFQCNHVTGDCFPCKPGRYGSGCDETCSCDLEGTEMCSNVDGKCYCKDNRFGLKCQMFCPFGFVNNTCHRSAIENSSCECSNYLHICDLELGCICPEGQDCGVQTLTQVLEHSPLSDEMSTGSTTAVVIAVLIIALAAVTLIIVYYRRRMKVLKTDLENRSIRYTENTHPYHTNPADIVITDNHPLEEYSSRTPKPGSRLRSQDLREVAGVELLNNQLSLASQHLLGNHAQTDERVEKNTNIDRFKLGLFDEPAMKCDQKAGCSELTVNLETESEDCTSGGACAMAGSSQGGAMGWSQGGGDVNILQGQIQNEKTVKPSLSLTFKNNISRETWYQKEISGVR